MIRATFNQARKGHYLQGIPARDLTEEEYRALSNAQRSYVRNSDLYEVKTDKEMADLIKSEAKPKPTEAPADEQPTVAEEEDDGD